MEKPLVPGLGKLCCLKHCKAPVDICTHWCAPTPHAAEVPDYTDEACDISQARWLPYMQLALCRLKH